MKDDGGRWQCMAAPSTPSPTRTSRARRRSCTAAVRTRFGWCRAVRGPTSPDLRPRLWIATACAPSQQMLTSLLASPSRCPTPSVSQMSPCRRTTCCACCENGILIVTSCLLSARIGCSPAPTWPPGRPRIGSGSQATRRTADTSSPATRCWPTLTSSSSTAPATTCWPPATTPPACGSLGHAFRGCRCRKVRRSSRAICRRPRFARGPPTPRAFGTQWRATTSSASMASFPQECWLTS
mmetsp:Transcript_83573/g.227058  ORF Transcript_83573/g.227058 Transcript_83573/m.227058 type:complete len:239 (-) Transcript_83573:132-848(-)